MKFRRQPRDTQAPEPRTPRARDTALFRGSLIEIQRLDRDLSAANLQIGQQAARITALADENARLRTLCFNAGLETEPPEQVGRRA